MRHVRLASVVLALGGLAACGGSSGGGATAVTVATAASAKSAPGRETGGETIAEAPAPARPNRCAKGGPFPALKVAPRPLEPAPLPCRPKDPAAESSIMADMRAQFKLTVPGSTLSVTFGCDGLDAAITRIVFERGAGHGGSLEIVQISRPEPAAATYDVLAIRQAPRFISKSKTAPFEVARQQIARDAVHARMPFLRAALHATLKEIEPKTPPQGMSAFGSSMAMHLFVRLEDAAGRSVQQGYSDSVDSDGQTTYLPLVRAEAELQQLLGKLPWQAEPAAEDAQQLFEMWFLDTLSRTAEPSSWWVRDTAIELAGILRARALVPTLLDVLAAPRPEGLTDPWERQQEATVAALVALTGWDPRVDEKGAPRPLEAATRDFLEECGKVSRVGW